MKENELKPQIIFGTANFGGIGSIQELIGKGNTEKEAFELLDAAISHGIREFDTANTYAEGESERILGRWLQKRSELKNEIKINTKVGNPLYDPEGSRPLERRQIFSNIEASLKRLGVSSISKYLVHLPDDATPIAETLQAFADLIKDGKILGIGVCNTTADQLASALACAKKNNLPRYELVQNGIHLINFDEDSAVQGICLRESIDYTPHSPLAGGILADRYQSKEDIDANSRLGLRPDPDYFEWLKKAPPLLESMRQKAKELGFESTAPLALQTLLNKKAVTGVTIGPRNLRQLEGCLRGITR